ncbi:RNA-binding protein 34 [Apis mellifera carnica]|uniref:RNA-binding protein 34 n=1 Tax=Apis mellifera TaxID=7460 RepID=A0A7M7GAT6_APIME|nr:RNA-binding protein 34 [Apis mellifera]KAG9433839.1 RNA-binding protein 34 [Apis mellifera carnica]|eukprot:XP_003250682.1 RNA-binding protein 34 [Apis mellifera]
MVKAVSTKNKDLISKNSLNSPKDGFIHKKKNQKFKQTPTGRVPLINGSKVQNNSSMKQQNLQMQKNNSSQKSPEQNKKLKKKNQEKNDKKQEPLKKQSIKKNVKVEEVESDSEDDINEGIKLEDSIMENSDDNENESFDNDDDDDESEEEEGTVRNILGSSLADESDEDDEDYEENKDTKVNKGIKMFDGSKTNDKSTDSIQDSSELSSIMEDSMIDDSDDEIDEEEEEEEENEDEDEDEDEDEEEEVDEEEAEEEEEEEEDDDDNEESGNEEEGDEEEGDESTLGLKALLSNSIAEDDDDDEDFVEPDENDEDDDISDEEEEEEGEEENKVQKNSSSNKNNKISMDTSLEEIKEDEKTIFVGNLPKDVTKKKLKKIFKQFGKIDTIRLRGKIAKSANVSKRVAAIKNELHPKLKSVYAYIKFVSKESVKESLSMNGTEFEGNYLRVNASNKSENKFDSKKSIFLGNLHYNIDDNTIIKHFKQCGEIESVRVIRDNKTGVGKGFGYVNFKNEDAVTLALELDGTTISNREVRVKPVVDQYKKKKDKYRKRSHSTENTQTVSHKKLKNDIEVPASVRNKENAMKRINEKGKKLEKKQTNSQQEKKFQGQKADANKKKKKPTKFEKKKKLLAEKLTAKSKKPSN